MCFENFGVSPLLKICDLFNDPWSSGRRREAEGEGAVVQEANELRCHADDYIHHEAAVDESLRKSDRSARHKGKQDWVGSTCKSRHASDEEHDDAPWIDDDGQQDDDESSGAAGDEADDGNEP